MGLMAEDKSTKHRRPRFSDREVEIMLICLEKQPELANGVLGEAFHSPLDQRMAWDAIAEALRSVSSAVRTGKDVRDKWRDLKSRAKQKAFRLKTKQLAGVDGKTNSSPLTELEEKALSLAKLVTRPATSGLQGRGSTDGLGLSATASSAEMSPASPTPSFASYALSGCLQEMTTHPSTPELMNGSLIGIDETEVKHLTNVNSDPVVVNSKPRPVLSLESGECSSNGRLHLVISNEQTNETDSEKVKNVECMERLANASAQSLDLEECRLQVEEQRLHIEEQRLQIEERRLQLEERRLQIKERQLQIEQKRFALLKKY